MEKNYDNKNNEEQIYINKLTKIISFETLNILLTDEYNEMINNPSFLYNESGNIKLDTKEEKIVKNDCNTNNKLFINDLNKFLNINNNRGKLSKYLEIIKTINLNKYDELINDPKIIEGLKNDTDVILGFYFKGLQITNI
jgi:hypothetical protein